jgi:hypothetical protein
MSESQTAAPATRVGGNHGIGPFKGRAPCRDRYKLP